MTWLERDPVLLAQIAGRLDLRDPNRRAISAVVDAVADGDGTEVVCDLATGVGKTWIMVGLVEYLYAQGVRNVLVVVPGKTILTKTLANFTPGSPKFVAGAEIEPVLITAENYSRGQVGDALHDPDQLKVFVFTVQSLLRPSEDMRRKLHDTDEYVGAALYAHLQEAEDLVVVADEHHVYRSKAKAFAGAIRDLTPRALVGLTATPDRSDADKVIFHYSLGEAIADRLVKVPVIVYREDGHKDERTQLLDACHLRSVKEAAALKWAEATGEMVHPVLFVVADAIEEAERIGGVLAGPDFLDDPDAVLVITSQSSDDALAELAKVDQPGSPVRAIVSVDKLKEGWDVKSVSVIVSRRPLISETLTEQILGRGLRLPYGERTGVESLDQVDIVAHDSYRQLLKMKDQLREVVTPAKAPASTEGAVGVPGGDGDPEAVVEDQTDQGHLDLRLRPRVLGEDGEPVGELGDLMMRVQGADDAIAAAERDLERVARPQTPVAGAPTVVFPRWELEMGRVTMSLSLVTDDQARTTGAAFAHEVKVPLTRRALDAQRTMDGSVEVRERAAAQEDATQTTMPLAEVRTILSSRVLGHALVPEDLDEVLEAERVVVEFLAGAGVSEGDDVVWGEARTQQAARGIANLVREAFTQRQMLPRRRFVEVSIPKERGLYPTDALNQFDPRPFVRGAPYDGWRQSMMPVASFDARSTEWVLAGMLDVSNDVEWWLRPAPSDGVYLELDVTRSAAGGGVAAGRYYPDFIVIGTDRVQWLVEGKSDAEATSPDVAAKKELAEQWAAEVTADGRWGTWRYLFATETVIAAAGGSWANLAR
jgi:type III restriction enzyme